MDHMELGTNQSWHAGGISTIDSSLFRFQFSSTFEQECSVHLNCLNSIAIFTWPIRLRSHHWSRKSQPSADFSGAAGLLKARPNRLSPKVTGRDSSLEPWEWSTNWGQRRAGRWLHRFRPWHIRKVVCAKYQFFSGLWFGTCFIFHIIYYEIILPIDSYFSRWLLHHQQVFVWKNLFRFKSQDLGSSHQMFTPFRGPGLTIRRASG